MKGGARPGAGRKKGQKDTKPRKGTEAHAENKCPKCGHRW